jgi:hypothetical protein
MVPTEETVAGYTPPTPLSTIGNFFSSETLLAAKEQYWLPDMAGRELVSQGFKDDPSWNPDLSVWEQQTKHVDPDLKLNILEARSGDHYNYLLTEAVNASRRRKILREAGYGGTMATVGAMIADPVSILTMAAGPIGVAGRTGIGAWATSGAINASLSLVTEGLRAELSPDLDASDAVTGAIGDFLFGFGIARANSMGANAAVRAATGFGAYAPSGALGAAWREDADIYDVGTAALVSGIMGGTFGAVAKTREAAAFDAATVRIANDWKTGRANFYTNGTIPTATVFNADDFVAAVSHVPPQQWAEMRAGRSDVPAAVVTPAAPATPRGPYSPDDTINTRPLSEQVDSAIAAGNDAAIQAQARDVMAGRTEAFDALKRRAEGRPDSWQADEVNQIEAEIARMQSAASPITHDDLKAGMTVRLYRGEGAGMMGESVAGGDWWTTDIQLARQYGNVTAVDIDALELGKISARGAYGNTTWIVDGGLDKLKSRGGAVVSERTAPAATAATEAKQLNYADWARQARSLNLPSSKDDFRSLLSIVTDNQKTPIAYVDGDGNPQIATDAFRLSDNDILQGDFTIPAASPAPQPDLSALSSAIRAGGEGQTQSPTFVNPLLRPDFKLGDMDASRVSLSPATTTLYIKDKDTKVPITMSMTAWASKDAIDARGTWFANATGTNYVPHKDGSVNRGLIEQVGAAVSNDTGNFNTGLAAMYRVEAKKAKQSGVAMPKQDEWMAQVTRAARGFTTGAAPGVVEAANAMRRGLDTNLDYYLRHAGIKREEAGNVAGYVPRIQKRDELDRLVKELGHDGAVTFYKNAILSDMRQSRVGQNQLELFPDLTPDQVAAKDEKVARRMAEAAIQYGGTKSGRIYHAGMSRADAEKVLDEIADLASDDKKHIIRSIFGRDEADNPRLRARTPLDESYSEVINDKTYTIEQLLENDPRVLYARYSHEMHSGSALEEAGRVYKALFNEDMPKTLAEFQQASAKWYTPGASSKSRAEALFRQLAGYAVHDLKDELDYALMGSTQVINAGVYMQVMASPRAGAMQLTESLNHLVQPEVSVPFMRKLFPVIDELSTSAMSGQLSDVEIIADAQLAGFGRGYASRIPGHVMDAADGYAKKFGPVTTAAEKITHFGNKWMAGEGPIGNSQEIAVYAGAVGHWVDFAVGRTGPLSNARLKALNLTPELQTEIGAMIRRFGTKDKAGRVVMPNERAWSNQAAAAAFREAVSIATRRLTNFGDASSMPTFAAKWYGKLFLQLRRFALRATGNYLGFNARMADRHAALTTASAAATGMLQYVVANVIAAATMQDREDFLNERLTTENIAKAAFARSAMAGIMPTVVDAGASAFGYDAPFSQYRQTYMATGASGVLANFAAADSLKNLTALPGAVLRPMIESDYDFSERNYNTITKGLFLPNYMGSLRAIREELNLPSRSETE